MRIRTLLTATATTLGALALSGPALAAHDAAGRARPTTLERGSDATGTLTVRSSRWGRVLFDSRGRALYAFTADRGGRSSCFGACLAAWPAYVVRGGVRAGAGTNRRLLATVARRNGSRQVTYNGRPLYYYVGDRRPGQILCQDVFEFGGLWLIMRPNGTLVR